MKFPTRITLLVAALLSLTACHHIDGPRSFTNARSTSGLAYDLVGEGPLIVLIHGTNLDRRMWDGEMMWMRKHARVLRYDLRGQGDSDFPELPYANHRDLIELLRELGEPEAILIGLSAGAQVALDVSLAAPALVSRAVLVSPSLSGFAPKEMPPFFAELSAALRAGDYDRANEVLLASSIMAVPAGQAERVRMMVEENSRFWTIPYSLVEPVLPPVIERLQDIRMPTLILLGENDLEAVRDQSAVLRDRMHDARRVVIPNGGHLLNLTSPELLREAVSEFLDF